MSPASVLSRDFRLRAVLADLIHQQSVKRSGRLGRQAFIRIVTGPNFISTQLLLPVTSRISGRLLNLIN